MPERHLEPKSQRNNFLNDGDEEAVTVNQILMTTAVRDESMERLGEILEAELEKPNNGDDLLDRQRILDLANELPGLSVEEISDAFRGALLICKAELRCTLREEGEKENAL